MKVKRFVVAFVRTLSGSAKGLGQLPRILLVLGLLSACSTSVDKDKAGATLVPPGTQQYLPGPSQSPLGPNNQVTPPISNYYPPNYNPPPNYPPPGGSPAQRYVSCTFQRAGGYYYTGDGVRWVFRSQTGEPLQISRIDVGEPWGQPPQYPLPSDLSIYFYTAGQRSITFWAQATSDGAPCNGGQGLQDTIYVNAAYGYGYGW